MELTNEAMFRYILDSIPYRIVFVDTDHIIRFLNKEARLKTTKALLSFPQVYAPLDQRYVEIFSKDAGKGKAFAFLQDYLSIDKCESACIGDGENDIHMFHHTGLKFAMGNGHPTLKKQADIVVKDNDHGGVVQALHILLHTHHAL